MKSNKKIEMGKKLRAMVKENGITATRFAEKLGVTKDTVFKWFAGNNTGYLRRSDEICKILGVSVLDVYTDPKTQKERIVKVAKDQEMAYLKGRIDQLEAIIVSLVRRGGIDFHTESKKNGTK